MRSFLESIFAQFRGFYQNLTPTKRMSILLVATLVVVTVMTVGLMLTGRSYVPLFVNVPGDQIGLLTSKLKEKNVPYELSDGGKIISVPPDLLHSTQMALMTEIGSNKLGTLGFELFDKDSFGTTSYAQRVNYQRALQGELMRAINSLDAVKSSKIILALPPKKTFLEEGGHPSASVVVDLNQGKMLSPDQVRGIVYLVASAVEGMDPDKVTVVDSRGKVLNKNAFNPSAAASGEILELKQRTEQSLEHRVESILERAVGQGKVIARVDAEINGQMIQAVEETVDPDKTALRSVQSEEESMNGARNSPSGVPGARANLPGAQDQEKIGFQQDVKKEMKTTNFDIPKTVRNIKENPGKIQKVSVAVMVDGTATEKVNENGSVEEVWTPRSADELSKYEALVKSAIGFNAARGDTVKIENVPFQKEDFEASNRLLSSLERRKLLAVLVRWLVIGISLALFFFMVVRPFMRWITDSFQESIDDMLPKTIEELEEIQAVDGTLPGMSSALPMLEESLDPDKAESELLKEKIMGLMESDSEKAAHALGLWLVRKE